jgi:3-mercaptopyruvate sulfurtransferase SseA
MKERLAFVAGALLVAAAAGCGMAAFTSKAKTFNVPMLSVEELKARLGSPDLTIIDVRLAEHWEKSRVKIPGAIHEEAEEVASWSKKYPKTADIVLYCD